MDDVSVYRGRHGIGKTKNDDAGNNRLLGQAEELIRPARPTAGWIMEVGCLPAGGLQRGEGEVSGRTDFLGSGHSGHGHSSRWWSSGGTYMACVHMELAQEGEGRRPSRQTSHNSSLEPQKGRSA